MKTFKYIGLTGLALLTISSLTLIEPAMAIEKAKYTVLEKTDDFEIRKYEPHIVAETFVTGKPSRKWEIPVFAVCMLTYPATTIKSSQSP